jgi:hypothetical protein
MEVLFENSDQLRNWRMTIEYWQFKDESHRNPKSQAPNYKWFDRLTTLSPVEG